MDARSNPGAVCGGLLSAYFSARYPPRPLIWSGIIVMGCGATVSLFTFLFGMVIPWTLFLPMAFTYGGMTVAYAAISSSITSEATDKSYASATMAFLTMGTAALSVLVVGAVSTKSAPFLPAMQLLLVGVMLAALITYIWLHRRPKKSTGR